MFDGEGPNLTTGGGKDRDTASGQGDHHDRCLDFGPGVVLGTVAVNQDKQDEAIDLAWLGVVRYGSCLS